MSILVFGSINMDLVACVPRLPAPGETLSGSDFFSAPGGKGANQAAACARLGAEVAMIGRVGNDVFGSTLRSGLQELGVDVFGVVDMPGPSGVAVIAVDERGENSIIVIPGANGQVGAEDLARLDASLPGKSSLLLQLEIPIEVITAAAQMAHTHGVRVILDPAPAYSLPEQLYSLIDIITPNVSEAASLVGFPVKDLALAEHASRVLMQRGVSQVIIKMGALGAYLHDGKAGELISGFPVEALDTTAAGDAFNGALAVALERGDIPREAVRFANAAGALSAMKRGAQPSMPSLKDVEVFLKEQKNNG